MNELIQEFDINIAKANHVFEMSLDTYMILERQSILMYESNEIDRDNLINNDNSNKDSLLNSVSDFIQKVIKIIKDFCDKIIFRIKSKIQANQIKHKLKSYKEALINNKQAANCDITIFDISRYMADYDKWIEWEVTETNNLLNKDFRTQEELELAISELEKKSEKYRAKLSITDKEAYALTLKIGEAIRYTEKQLDDIDRLTKISGTWDTGVKKIEYVYLKKPESRRVYLLKRRVNDITSTCKVVIGTIASAIMKTLSAIQSLVKKLIAGMVS